MVYLILSIISILFLLKFYSKKYIFISIYILLFVFYSIIFVCHIYAQEIDKESIKGVMSSISQITVMLDFLFVFINKEQLRDDWKKEKFFKRKK